MPGQSLQNHSPSIVHKYKPKYNHRGAENTEKILSKMIIVYLLLQVGFSGKSLSPFCMQILRSFAR